MPPQQPHYSAEETARRGDEIYERVVRARVEAENHGKVVAIDIETGAYALDENALAATKRLRAQHPDAEIWFVWVGHCALHRLGLRSSRPLTRRLLDSILLATDIELEDGVGYGNGKRANRQTSRTTAGR